MEIQRFIEVPKSTQLESGGAEIQIQSALFPFCVGDGTAVGPASPCPVPVSQSN